MREKWKKKKFPPISVKSKAFNLGMIVLSLPVTYIH